MLRLRLERGLGVRLRDLSTLLRLCAAADISLECHADTDAAGFAKCRALQR